ncbi:hypothetical protein FT663_02336 [Candidozyma haemuli var. vulneris]|uniref:Major facilitator superfamily (MFS) profile domain-containing protein n=1 Tax=Candidozyma haemuli TaxID=45357 RepID=A0A2V1AP55_9ASCO|nr:hypothetical protein CXQ85_001007 [[Candida] haemuloni]KAF3992279.1 hypothetical protein FT663_02336 [[Candida] haemuloni var. vulneris]KAF3994230.1 hypothetical protein FT662_00099 [[Candida] haemuloni var. vulneris]PVH18721.1 hypothetical protein CXQ85_001007 [[Candida] haemuloni]
MALTFREQLAGFPVRQMLVVSLIRFSEPLAFTSLFPYLYFMIRDFQIAPTEKEISKYSGYLASSFAFCQFLCAVQWGKMSNRVGRKPILLFGLFGTSMSLLLFGFSTNYYMALAARSLAGCLNGNIAVLRTMIGEICVERKHQAIGFSTLPLLFNFGSVIGPLVGGSYLLTRPSPRSPYEKSVGELTVQSGFAKFRAKHPYALANIVVSGFLWFSLIVGFLFLEETNEDVFKRRDIGLEIGDSILYYLFGRKRPVRPWHGGYEDPETGSEHFSPQNLQEEGIQRERGVQPDTASIDSGVSPFSSAQPSENTPLLQSEDDSSLSDDIDNAVQEIVEEGEPIEPYISRRTSRSMSNAVIRRYSSASEYIPKPEPRALTPQVITVILSNCIISLHSIAYNEFLPVFLAGRFQRDKLQFPFRIEGGFGLDSSYIGTLFSSTGIMGMLIVLIIFPWIDRRLGTMEGFRLSLLFFPIVYAAVPMAIFTQHSYNPAFPEWLTPIILYGLTSLKTLASATGMPQVMLLNHRAAAKQHRAYVNSLTMSMLALARCIGPIVFGWLMTLGDNWQIGWLNWWLMALLALFGLFQSLTMRDYED